MSQDVHQLDKQERIFKRDATIISAITAVALTFIAISSILRGDVHVLSLLIFATVNVAVYIAAFLSYYGRYQLGTRIIFVAILIGVTFITLITDGDGAAGVVFGTITLVIGSTIALLTRSQAQAARWIVVFGIFAVFAVIYDLFGLPGRQPVSNTRALYNIALGLVLLYGIFIAYQFPRFSLRTKLIATTAIVAIIAVALVTVIVGMTTRNSLITQVGNNLNNLAQTQALAVGEVLARQINILETMALTQNLTDGLLTDDGQSLGHNLSESEIADIDEAWRNNNEPELLQQIMSSPQSEQLLLYQQTFPEHGELVLTDANGLLVAAAQRPSQFDFSGESWWQNAYSSGFVSVFISQPYENEETGELLIDIAVPVQQPDSNGRLTFLGILASSYNVAALADILAQASLGQSSHFDLLINPTMQIEATDTPNYQLTTLSQHDAQLIESLWANSLSYINDIYHDEQTLISQGRVNTLANEPKIDSLGWRVIAVQSEEDALVPVLQQERTNILMGVAIIVVASVTAAVVGQFLSEPIIRLTTMATKVAEGDLTARADVISQDEIGTLAIAFNDMTSQLQEAIVGLEQRVEERTKALTASAEVSRSLSTILDPNQLISEVVEQVRAAFGYYYVQIYLLDELKENLIMSGGTGEAGQLMFSRQHFLPVGQGLVGQSALQNKAIFIPDVYQAPEWKSNPLLPDTKSEITVPIAIGAEVLGVLDVQHDVANVLNEEVVGTLQSVGYQVAIAIQNARSYDVAQKRAEHEAKINSISQKIQNATSVDAVLQIAAAELGSSLGQNRAIVELYNPVHGSNGREQHNAQS